MAETAIAAPDAHGLQAIDSLTANEFALEVDGEVISGVFKITGFHSFKLDVKTTTAMKLEQSPFKIVKMVRRDANDPFNRWIRETVAAGADIVRPKRTLSIVAIDDGVEIRRWSVKEAWISEISYSDFDAASGEMVEETVSVRYRAIEERWLGDPEITTEIEVSAAAPAEAEAVDGA